MLMQNSMMGNIICGSPSSSHRSGFPARRQWTCSFDQGSGKMIVLLSQFRYTFLWHCRL
ncbi:hypothetical protein I656_03896 [Geobacillus sp. WSUCF1]|nr:hypothetical protein I656_03896 [Geobacillus sp. WSUCF1]